MKFIVYNKEVEINDDLVKKYETVVHEIVNNDTIEYLLIAGDVDTNESISVLKERIEFSMKDEIEAIKNAPSVFKAMVENGDIS